MRFSCYPGLELPTLSQEWIDKIKALTEREMTPEEEFEQRVSFVYGCLPHKSLLTKDQIRVMLRSAPGVPLSPT